jgi:hypothetical protein
MGAYLTFADYADYADPVSGEIELSEEGASYRAFWAAVLSFAAADGASAVCYRLDEGEDCLLVETDGDSYPMIPPPPEYRKELLAAGRRLACGGRSGYWMNRLLRLVTGSRRLGSLELQTHSGTVTWRAADQVAGLSMRRIV